MPSQRSRTWLPIARVRSSPFPLLTRITPPTLGNNPRLEIEVAPVRSLAHFAVGASYLPAGVVDDLGGHADALASTASGSANPNIGRK